MKNCEQIAPMLSAYVDGELAEEECVRVRAHLDECEECGARLSDWLAMHEAFGTWEEAEVPEGFTAGVMDAVRAEKAAAGAPRTGARGTARRWMSLAACAAVALIAAVTIPQMRPEKAADNGTASESVAQQEMMFATTADDDHPAEPEEEYPEQRCETVQSSPYYSMTSGGAANDARLDGDMRKAEASDNTEYGYETIALGLSGESGNVLTNEYGTVLLVLCGPGAADYVAENGGVADGESGEYFVPIEALRDLPESLALDDLATETLRLAPAEAEWVLVYPVDGGEVTQP